MSGNGIIFKVKEKVDNIEIVFTKSKLEEKKGDHPELLNKEFLKFVEKALINPDEVWPNYKDNRKRCYYKRCDNKKYSNHKYVKVVVWIKDEPFRVVSAYGINRIKETKYSELKRII